jgi:UDP-N-acetylmuramoyl-tripeptide--D-alanyl-D-alanine ligase
MASRTRARAMTYGFAADADVRAEDVASRGADGMIFRLVAAGVDRRVAIPSLGRLAVHNALAAAAVGLAAGIPADTIAAGLAAGWSAPHRGELIRVGGVTIVDDSYNASPGSVAAALELLSGMPGRRIAVLGEMLELGSEREAGHLRVGEAAADLADRLVVIGEGAASMAAGARRAGMPAEAIATVADPTAALERLLADLRPGDVILVKASRGIGLDQLVDELRSALTAAGPARQ